MTATSLFMIIVTAVSFYLLPLVVSFYHLFESKQTRMDNHALVTVVVLGVALLICVWGY